MVRYRQGIILLVVLASASSVLGSSLSDAVEIIQLGQQVVEEAIESWQKIIENHQFSFDKPFNPFNIQRYLLGKSIESALFERIDRVSRKIDEFQDHMETTRADEIMVKLLLRLPSQQKLEKSLMDLDRYINQVDALYNIFELYANNSGKYEKYTMVEFAKTCVSSRSGELTDILESIHRLIVPSQNNIYDRSVLVLLAKQMKEASNQMCNDNQSPQQLLYNLYNAVALAEIKGYTMIQFSYMLLRLYKEGSDFSEEIQTLKRQYAIRTSETLNAVKIAMVFAPRSLWRCEPSDHKLDETYTELTELFQGYIVNEVDLNNQNTCKENCAYYSLTTVQNCYQNQFCAKQRQCNGKVLHCEYIDSDMTICPADKTSPKRYEYIEYENGMHFGNAKTCSNPTIKVDSWWRWLFWHCSYCFCYCEQNTSSNRYVSLRSIMSDISNNKVITGVKFEMIDKILHIQVKEGQLLPRGAINASTIKWQPIDTFSLFDDVISSVDFHTIKWEQRALDLDDLSSPKGHLLTGIRFRLVGSRLNLEIRVTPFNFTSGLLIKPNEKSYWHSNDTTDRTELKLDEPDIPIRQSLPHEPNFTGNQYLNFGPSDRRKDAAQSVIPFIDVQSVVPYPPVPLAGAGIFHKGRKGSGGFVALKLTTYDFVPHLQIDLPPATPVLETPNKIRAT